MPESEFIDRFINEYWGDHLDSAMGEAREKNSQPQAIEKFSESYDLLEDQYKDDGYLIRPMKSRKLEKRTILAMLCVCLLVPLLLYISVRVFHGRKYLLCSLIIVVGAMVPFFMAFEGRRPQARELMVISVLSALAVAGRAAFFMVPNFKPVAAMVILTGISLGGEAGFLCGCITMIISNMFIGQGPWTPWQMFSYGLIGFLAGVLFKKGMLKPKKQSLCIFGFLSVIFIYGGIMNPASVLMAFGYFTKANVIAYYISGIPVDLVHATSTVIFLYFISKPLLEKIERIKVKYGLYREEQE